MKHFPDPARTLRVLAALAIVSAVPSCDSDFDGILVPPPDAWTWTDLGAPAALASPYVSNHEPLVAIDDELLLGTVDGVWRRALDGSGEWQQAGLGGKTIHALALTKDGDRILAAGFDPEDERGPTAWYSTDEGGPDCADWAATSGPAVP
jgi:hypothetical protein